MARVDVEALGPGREGLRFYCVACSGFHVAPIKLPEGEIGETYEWNGDKEKPTIVPMFCVPGKCIVSIRDGVAYYGLLHPRAPGQKADIPHILERIHA